MALASHACPQSSTSLCSPVLSLLVLGLCFGLIPPTSAHAPVHNACMSNASPRLTLSTLQCHPQGLSLLSLQDSPLPSTSLSPSPPCLLPNLAEHKSSPMPHIGGIAPALQRPLAQRASGSMQIVSLGSIGLASFPDNSIGFRMNSFLVSHSPIRPAFVSFHIIPFTISSPPSPSCHCHLLRCHLRRLHTIRNQTIPVQMYLFFCY